MENVRAITFDGMDVNGPDGTIRLGVERINVWRDYENRNGPPTMPANGKRRWRRPIVATVQHGETGILLERVGNKCKVRTKKGKVGYVTFWFIEELKQAWLNQRMI